VKVNVFALICIFQYMIISHYVSLLCYSFSKVHEFVFLCCEFAMIIGACTVDALRDTMFIMFSRFCNNAINDT